MTVFKYVCKSQGPAHVKVVVFAAPDANQTFARLGELIMRNEEFDDFRSTHESIFENLDSIQGTERKNATNSEIYE